MFWLSINIILQYIAVVIILIIAIVFIVKKLRRSKHSGCSGCALFDSCVSKNRCDCLQSRGEKL